MKVENVRIDERLIHGQIAAVWTNYLSCTRIIVANDAAPKNEMDIAVLRMACPTGVKLSILSVSKAVANINAGKYADDSCFLIFKNVADCKRAIEEGLDVEVVNVGNASHKAGSIKIKNNVGLLPDEIEDVKALLARGIRVTTRMIPNHPMGDIEEFLP